MKFTAQASRSTAFVLLLCGSVLLTGCVNQSASRKAEYEDRYVWRSDVQGERPPDFDGPTDSQMDGSDELNLVQALEFEQPDYVRVPASREKNFQDELIETGEDVSTAVAVTVVTVTVIAGALVLLYIRLTEDDNPFPGTAR